MRKFKKAVVYCVIIAILAVTASSMSAFVDQCQDIRSKVVRLHILANSNSTQDQALKLKVRDKILASSSELFTISDTKAEALKNISSKLTEIQQIAQSEVDNEGYSYEVTAKLVNMYFNTRTYGNVTLPAGNYDALRIEIGKAEGHNWWCVLFPPLCVNSAQAEEKLSSVMNDKEYKIITGKGDDTVVIKFKVLEWFDDIKNFFNGK